MRFRVLGPLEVLDDAGQPVELGSPKLRTLLTLLLADAGRVVPLDRILDMLWDDAPPATATATVQTYVSNLRRLLEPARGPRTPPTVVLTRPHGYLVAADAGSLDALRLPELVTTAGQLLDADPAQALEAAQQAVALWRGEPLSDLPDTPEVVAERVRLAELHVLAREQVAVAHTRLGQADTALADLERLVAEHPLRERLRVRYVEALWACGRQADALDACRQAAQVLRDELGIDPGPELRAVEQRVLRQELPVAVPVQRVERVATRPPERPLVGRRTERARLRTLLAEVTAGNGAVVVLEGEAGIGKTRLAEAATAMAGAQGWQVAWSRCADDAGAPALWPWTQLLEQLGAEPLRTATSDDPDRSRFALFQDLRARLQKCASVTPLLVVLDDIQAADATSLQLLQLLAQHLDGVRLLVVVTVRTVGEQLSSAVLDCLAVLAREPRCQRLLVSGLGEGDVRELVTTTLGEQGEVALTREVHARTGGNPFFVVELVRLLHSEHRLDCGPALPPSVRDVLERRLGRLPHETVELLRLAAVAGRDVDLALLQTLADLDAEQVLTRLEPAVAAGILLESVAWQWRFNHALVQETLVAGLSRLAAARLHARVATVLESRANVDVERLAHHYVQAVPITGPEPALRFAVAAADVARERLAHTEAAAHTRRALSLLDASDVAGRLDLLVALGDDLLREGHLLDAQDVIAEALTLARESGDQTRLAEAASVWGGVTLWNWRGYGIVDEPLVDLLEELKSRDEDPRLRVRLLGTLGVELAYSDRRNDGVRYVTQAVDLARELGDPVLLGRALNNYSLVTWGSDDRVERRMAAADESLSLAGRGLPARTEFYALLHRGPLRLHLGDLAGFRADLAAATRLAERLTGPEVRPHVRYQEAGLAMVEGNWAEAEVLAAEAHELYAATSMWGARCCAALHSYTFRRREGRLAEALDDLVDAADALHVPILQEVAVLAAAEAGDRDEARRLQRRWPRQEPQDWTSDALAVVRARTALALGGDVTSAFAALSPYRGRQIVVGTATACWGSYDLVLGQLALAEGDSERADDCLQTAVLLGEQVESPWQVEQARALLERSALPV